MSARPRYEWRVTESARLKMVLVAVCLTVLGLPRRAAAQWSEWEYRGQRDGVSYYIQWNVEAKEFVLKFENGNSHAVNVSYSVHARCNDGTEWHEEAGVPMRPNETVGGELAGLFYYPCNEHQWIDGSVSFAYLRVTGN